MTLCLGSPIGNHAFWVAPACCSRGSRREHLWGASYCEYAIAEADGMQPIVPQDIPGCDVWDSRVERGLPQLLLPAPPGETGGAGPGPTAGGGAADIVHAAG